MTAIPYPQPRPNYRLIILAAILSTAAGAMLTTRHATDRHGEEAAQIRQCMESNGPLSTWQDDERPDIQVFCVEVEPEPCPKWGIIIYQLWPSLAQGCDIRERSSYRPADGSPERVTDYLERFASPIE